jgi:hypothetical protein
MKQFKMLSMQEGAYITVALRACAACFICGGRLSMHDRSKELCGKSMRHLENSRIELTAKQAVK